MEYPLYEYYKNRSLTLDEIVDHYVTCFYAKKHDGKTVLNVLNKVRNSSKIKNLCGQSATRRLAPNFIDFIATINGIVWFMLRSNMTQALAVLFAALYWDEKINSVYHLKTDEELRDDIIKVFKKLSIYEEMTEEEYNGGNKDNTKCLYNRDKKLLKNKNEEQEVDVPKNAVNCSLSRKEKLSGLQRYSLYYFAANIAGCMYFDKYNDKTPQKNALDLLHEYQEELELTDDEAKIIVSEEFDLKLEQLFGYIRTIEDDFEINNLLMTCAMLVDLGCKEHARKDFFRLAKELGFSEEEVKDELRKNSFRNQKYFFDKVTVITKEDWIESVRIEGSVCNKDKNRLLINTYGINIPYGVSVICDEALKYQCIVCEDKDIIIPDSVTHIGDRAFCYQPINSVTIPKSVIHIGVNPFIGCKELKEIVCESDKYTFVDGALFTKDMKILVCCINRGRSFEIPKSVQIIGAFAFEGCENLSEITIPNSILEIGDNSFSGCSSLAEISIPDSIELIGDAAFANNAELEYINIPRNTILYQNDNLFAGCTNLHKIDWDTIHAIKDGTLIYNMNRKVLIASLPWQYIDEIQNSWPLLDFVKSHGKLKSGNFSTVDEETGEERIFKSLVCVDPADNKTINCYIRFSSNLGELSDKEIIARKNDLIVVQSRSGNYSLSQKGMDRIYPDKIIELPEGVEAIASNAFWGNEDLEEITLPKSLITIGKDAFKGCSSLKAVHIPQGTLNRFEEQLPEWKNILYEEREDDDLLFFK